jgi:predicted TIM-barrel fold metal-dependent hydrolase
VDSRQNSRKDLFQKKNLNNDNRTNIMSKKKAYTRREFIKKNSLTGLGAALTMSIPSLLLNSCTAKTDYSKLEPIIDIHQHTPYGGRPHENMLAHQRAMGIAKSILLPAGSPVNTVATHNGQSNGLAAGCGGNEECYQFSQKYPEEFFFGANEVPGLPGTVDEIEKYLNLGAKVIGESKFAVDCDSPEMQEIYELAQAYDVPVLMHWQYERYNHGFERFHTMLEKYPNVNFIGHSRTFWANIGKEFVDQTLHTYPEGIITPGGWTDQLLSRYPNMYGDLSQRSGLTALIRDEEHTPAFLERHQDQLLFGSDCSDQWPVVDGAICTQGSPILDAVRRLSPTKEIERKVLYENAKSLFKIDDLA